MINKIYNYFEKGIVLFLLFALAIIIIISSIELIFSIIQSISNNQDKDYYFLDMQESLNLLSTLLMVVISLELFETIKYYLEKNKIQADFILIVALTAMARKIIVINYSQADLGLLIGISVTILALSIGYFLIKKASYFEKNKEIEKISK